MSDSADSSNPPRQLERLATGFRKRTLASARLGMKVGFKMLGKTVRPNAGKKDAADEAAATEAAMKLLAQLDGMKGLLMKFGQMASYLDHSLPPSAQKVLAKLQASSTPMSFDVIGEVVRDELGGEATELYEAFEPDPFAAASIGQVHRARFEGREVAVKIQYPGIEKTFKSDLRTLGALTRVATIGSPLSGGSLVKELRERMLDECDYENEAKNQRLFARLLADEPGVGVPEVIGERSARRVLTTELIDGRRFQEFAAEATSEERDRAGAAIFRVCFQSLMRHCAFNADPHPGNYLFEEGGRVVFLDYGCVRMFEAELIDRWKDFAHAVIDGDRARFRETFIGLGMVAKERKFDWDYQWEVFQYLYEPFLTTEPYTYTHEHIAKSFDVLMWQNPNKFKITMPPEWLFLNRLQWGLQSVLAQLGATARWGQLWRDAIDTPTEPASL
jgi:predicted unusual protein kinase regulating ubiquinone biosynthesis (AarF/ABC1/UbiB family)